VRYWFSLLIITVYFLSLGVNLAAQDFSLPSPIKIIPVEKLDFTPDASNSCISVEGPEIVKHEDNTLQTLPDEFTRCSLKLFEPLLDSRFKDGTQKNADAIDALMQCSNVSTNLKHLILVGHGSPGSIATGNGTNPNTQVDQNIDVGTTDAINKLRLLKATELVLFGCETGIGEYGMQLLNKLAEQKFPSRARNSVVMCSLDEAHNGALKGLYVLKGADQLWVTAQPKELLAKRNDGAQPVDIDPGSCFALKGPDGQFKVMAKDQFSSKKQHREISSFDLQSESALRGQVISEFDILSPRAFTKDGFHTFLAGDSDLLESIDFCQVLRPDLVPDGKVVGTFTLTIDGNLRQFYELRGGLVQDSEHKEVYYRAKPNSIARLHLRVLQENDRLLRLQQDKLQKDLQMEQKHE
jgi:hypothetical protein